MAGDAVSLNTYQNCFLQELRDIDTEIDQYNLDIKNSTNNEEQKKLDSKIR